MQESEAELLKSRKPQEEKGDLNTADVTQDDKSPKIGEPASVIAAAEAYTEYLE
jgi:hypothetical protein